MVFLLKKMGIHKVFYHIFQITIKDTRVESSTLSTKLNTTDDFTIHLFLTNPQLSSFGGLTPL